MKKVRAVIIGCGGFCRNTLLGIQSHEAFDIVAVVDPVECNRQKVGKMAKLGKDRQFDLTSKAFAAVEAHAENCRVALAHEEQPLMTTSPELKPRPLHPSPVSEDTPLAVATVADAGSYDVSLELGVRAPEGERIFQRA